MHRLRAKERHDVLKYSVQEPCSAVSERAMLAPRFSEPFERASVVVGRVRFDLGTAREISVEAMKLLQPKHSFLHVR